MIFRKLHILKKSKSTRKKESIMVKAAGIWMLLLALACPDHMAAAFHSEHVQAVGQAASHNNRTQAAARSLHIEIPESPVSSGRENNQHHTRHLHPFAQDVVLIDAGHGGIDGEPPMAIFWKRISILKYRAGCLCCSGSRDILPCSIATAITL